MNLSNQTAAPKTSTFQMRINPEIKRQAEDMFSAYGLTLTDAVNIFIQQSLTEKGLPFLLSPENEAYQKAKAAARLMSEIDKGWNSVRSEQDWVSEEEAYQLIEAES